MLKNFSKKLSSCPAILVHVFIQVLTIKRALVPHTIVSTWYLKTLNLLPIWLMEMLSHSFHFPNTSKWDWSFSVFIVLFFLSDFWLCICFIFFLWYLSIFICCMLFSNSLPCTQQCCGNIMIDMTKCKHFYLCVFLLYI